MSFISQYDYHSCGPVALFNALRYFDSDVRISILRRLCLKWRPDPYYGLFPYHFDMAINELFTNKKSENITLSKLKSELKDNIVILLYYVDKHSGHYVLITDYNNDKFTVINNGGVPDAEPVQYLSDSQMKKLLAKRKNDFRFLERQVNIPIEQLIEKYPTTWSIPKY